MKPCVAPNIKENMGNGDGKTEQVREVCDLIVRERFLIARIAPVARAAADAEGSQRGMHASKHTSRSLIRLISLVTPLLRLIAFSFQRNHRLIRALDWKINFLLDSWQTFPPSYPSACLFLYRDHINWNSLIAVRQYRVLRQEQ